MNVPAMLRSMLGHTRWFLVTAVVLGLLVGVAAQSYAATIINISDLTEGAPTVTQSGSDTVTITPVASQKDFVRFTFTVATAGGVPAPFLGTTSVDIFSQAPGPSEALSDRFLITVTSPNNFDVQFDSRDSILIPTGTNQSFSQEDGNLHQMYNLDLSDAPQITIFAASEVIETAPVPEPSTILLGLTFALLSLAVYRRGRASRIFLKPVGTTK